MIQCSRFFILQMLLLRTRPTPRGTFSGARTESESLLRNSLPLPPCQRSRRSASRLTDDEQDIRRRTPGKDSRIFRNGLLPGQILCLSRCRLTHASDKLLLIATGPASAPPVTSQRRCFPPATFSGV